MLSRVQTRLTTALATSLSLALCAGALAAEPGEITLPPALGGAMIGDGEDSLQVIVGPGGVALDELAVPDARCAEGATKSACRAVVEVLRRDMQLSFVFQVLPPRSYLADVQAAALETPQYKDWTNIGARFLIKSEVSGAGPFKARFRLFNVTTRELIPVAEQDFEGLGKGQLRKAAHRFANGVLKARTGTAGVFDTQIAFSQRLGIGVKGIGIVDMDGANKHTLISNGSINTLPAWGFGGVLYTSFRDGQPELFFGKRKLSKDGGHFRKAAVSPDGARMVASISYGGQSDLYLMNKDGSVVRNLTNTPADEVSPTFSPDGSKIGFVSSAAGSPQLYTMSVDGGEPTRLTYAGSYNYAPDWGPNNLIVFAGMEDSQSDIFTVTETGEVARLTQEQGNNKDPSWSGDGRYVAFVSRRAEGSGVYIMSADGRYQALVSRGGGVGNTAWER